MEKNEREAIAKRERYIKRQRQIADIEKEETQEVQAEEKTRKKKKKRQFEETRVGHFLKHEAPLEYGIIMEVSGTFSAPSADLIEVIGYASLNLLFRKPKFRKALIEYRKHGLYAGQPKKSSAELELFYKRVQKKNMMQINRKM